MNTLVIDASVAVKWGGDGGWHIRSAAASTTRGTAGPGPPGRRMRQYPLKKGSRDELSSDEAFLASQLLQAADLEFLPARPLLEAATRLVIQLGHSAYDCMYIALAADRDCRFVTADERLVRKLSVLRRFRGRVISLMQAAS